MRPVGSLLREAVTTDEALRTARAQRALRSWEGIVGPQLAGRSHPDRFERGTVWVAVEGSAWAQELRMMKDKILARLRERSGEPKLFLDVRFGVRPIIREATPAAQECGQLPDYSDLSISEIARRRIESWPSGGKDEEGG